MSTIANSPILCFGEILWDCLPQGLFAGGAPINVAYHLKQLGLRPIPVTAVGSDFLGQELLERLGNWGLETDAVISHAEKMTGVVRVKLDSNGLPTYQIMEDVAWDWIEIAPTLNELAPQSAALVFGTLAQRSENNRRQFRRLIELAPKAKKVLDVNLRPPFDSHELVWELSKSADVIKLNQEELHQLLGRAYPATALEEQARALEAKTGCHQICVTAGASGAGLLQGRSWYWAEVEPIEVKDTVGAGDAFLAALLHGIVTDPDHPQQFLTRCCRLAEFVASQEGATPAYTVSPQGEVFPRR